MAQRSELCSVWLGSETGILKGVSLARRQAFNFTETGSLSRGQELRVLSWGDAAETELLLGAVDGTVRTFSTTKGLFTESRRCAEPDHGAFTGLAVAGSALVTCVETGRLRLWKEEGGEPALEVDAGRNVCRMRQSPVRSSVVATGGKENGLRVWDLERPEQPLFSAKNVRNDWLDLRRPEWVRDMAFIPGSEKVVTCTGHHEVRIYDPAASQRRPVLEARYGEHPLTCLSLAAGGTTVVVGNTQGQVAMLDLRKGLVHGCLKGLAGGVRGLQCHPSLPLVASCGLDRFLRVHSLEDRTLQHKVYLKSRLNCILLAGREPEEPGGGEAVEATKEEEVEVDEVWSNMEKIGTEKTKRRSGEQEEEEGVERKSKKKKKKAAKS